MFYLIKDRIPRDQINAHEKKKNIEMDINYLHDICNHIGE